MIYEIFSTALWVALLAMQIDIWLRLKKILAELRTQKETAP